MRAREFWRTVTVDEANVLDRLIDLLRTANVPFCVIGGQAVNAYAEPVVSLDLDIAIAAGHAERLAGLLTRSFRVERFTHSLNVSDARSDLRVQIQLDPRYEDFVARSAPRLVLGVELPVAAISDVLQGKVWAAQDPERRGSKRQKDLADISRLIEAHPEMRASVPADILKRLL